MNKTICTRYSLKLNQDHESYIQIISDIEAYLAQCHIKKDKLNDPDESYGASSCEFYSEIVVSFHSISCKLPLSLSAPILDLIKTNINSRPHDCYYFFEEEEISGWHVVEAFGKALPIFEKYSSYRRVAGNESVSKFQQDLYA